MDLTLGCEVGFCANDDNGHIRCRALDPVYLLAERFDFTERGFLCEATAGGVSFVQEWRDGRT